MDECGINGIVYAEGSVSGAVSGDGHIQGQVDSTGNIIGEVGFPKCCCDYDELINKPSINGVPLEGDKTTEDLGIEAGVSSWNGETGDVTFSEQDPTVPSWAKQPTKPTYTAEEVGALPVGTTLGDLDNDVGYITGIVTDLGNFDIEDYDWDIWNYLADKTESGFYTAYEEQDGFNYYITVQRSGDVVYQEYWSTEENSLVRYMRSGVYDGEEWSWDDMTSNVTQSSLSLKYYDKIEVDNLLGNYYTDVQVDDILDNNYYTIDQVDELLEQFSPTASTMTPILWADLVELRDNKELVSGTFYRITDYNFITTKLGVQSGNHQFDIVLLAISESMLSESGYACKHEGDTYFEREITEGGIEWLYTLYVDDLADSYGDEPMNHQDDLHSSDEFCDAGYMEDPDTGDVVPVLYKTDTGQYDIDDPDYDDAYFYVGTYDLDGDDYDMWAKYEYDADNDEWVFMQQYALTPLVVEDGELTVSPVPETKIVPVNMNAWQLKYCLDNDKELFDWAETNGKGVIYWLKDEFGNEAPYDFKNATFRRYQVAGVNNAVLNPLRNMYLYQDGNYAITKNNNSKYWYTFASSDGVSDGSLFGECTYNVIMPYIYLSPKGKNIRGINDIVLQNANQNTLGNGCNNITILNSASGNVFESNSYNICGTAYSYSRFEYAVRSITLVGMARCKFGSGSNSLMGQQIDACETKGNCANINFGNYNSNLRLGSGCTTITFGQWCYSVLVGDTTTNITFGNYCSYSTIGMQCSNIVFTNYYKYICIEDYVARITFTTSGGNTSNYVQYVKLCRGLTNKSIAPTRRLAYEQIYYTVGRVETAL